MRKVAKKMNIYNDDVILLSEQSTKTFLSSLITKNDSISLRDKFIANIKDNILISDNGESIIVDIPDIEFIDKDGYANIDSAKSMVVETEKVQININISRSKHVYYCTENMQQYGTETIKNPTKYNPSRSAYGDGWNISTEYQVA